MGSENSRKQVKPKSLEGVRHVREERGGSGSCLNTVRAMTAFKLCVCVLNALMCILCLGMALGFCMSLLPLPQRWEIAIYSFPSGRCCLPPKFVLAVGAGRSPAEQWFSFPSPLNFNRPAEHTSES